MINCLFLDPRTYKIDYQTSPFWEPEKYGVKVDLHPDAFHIPKTGVSKKYKAVITTEVWEIPIQKTLNYLRNKGLKILLVPREISPTKAHIGVMFNLEKYRYKNSCYFTPDLVLATNRQYGKLWVGKTKRKVIGYPRFDVYLKKENWKTRNQILERHGLEKNKRIIYFPAYPPYHVQTVNNKNVKVDLFKDLQNTMHVLEQYASSHPNTQVVVKIHPMSFKCYKKSIGSKKEVAGLVRKYYEKPTKYLKVIGDIRNDSSVAREMIILADLIVGYTSMMLLEAIIVGKPVLHVKFEQCMPLKNALEFSNDIPTVYNSQDLLKSLDEGVIKKVDSMNLVERYLYKVDGKFCERLCSEIKQLV